MEYMDETTLAHKHTSPWLIAFRIIFTIALVWCILFIFHNSLETSSISVGTQPMRSCKKSMPSWHISISAR